MTPKKWRNFLASARRELRRDAFGLNYARPNRFCKSQWHREGSSGCTSAYLAFRWFVAAYLVAGLLVSLVDLRALAAGLEWPQSFTYRAKWFIFLTNWALLVLTVQAAMAAWLATNYHFAEDKTEKSMTVLHKTYWVLNNLGNVMSPGVTLLYWTSVYNKDFHEIDFGNVHGHIMNTVVVVLDILLTAHPVRLLHIIQPMLFGFTYAFFSLIYFFAGGTNRDGGTKIYPFLDWNRPLVAISYSLCASILMMVMHVLVWLFYKLRRFVALQLGTLNSMTEPRNEASIEVRMNSLNQVSPEKQQIAWIS